MTEDLSVDEAARRLSDALKQRELPGKTKKAGQRLLDRLNTPVRITLLGPSTKGKRLFANALAGQTLVPQDLRLPTFEVCRGEAPGIRVTLRDGRYQDLEGHDFEAVADLRPSFVQVFTEHPFFRNVTLLSVVTDGTADQQLAAGNWAAKRTDIAIWVTPEFSARQRELWWKMPETLHEHCFLVPIAGPLASTPARYSRPAPGGGNDDFLGVYPLSVDTQERLLQDEQVGALRKELNRYVGIGIQENIDLAVLFLNDISDKAPDAGETATDRAVEAAGAAGSDLESLLLESFSTDGPGRNGADIGHQNRTALEIVKTDANEMLGTLECDQMASAVTRRCSESAQKLCDVVAPDNPLYDIVSRAAEYLVLLDLEKDDESAHNAVSGLLQVKRAIEIELAA